MTTSKKVAKVPPINFGDGNVVPNVPIPDNIYGAILAVMGQVGYVQKQSSPQLSYRYASEAALIAAIRPWLVHFGVLMYVVDITDVDVVDRPRDRGGNTRHVALTAVVRFYHAHSDTFIDVKARGEGADVSDKAWNKAQTGAKKYALRHTFTIETGDDPDTTHNPVPARAEAAGLVKPHWVTEDEEPLPDEEPPLPVEAAPEPPPTSAPPAPSEPPPSGRVKLATLDVSIKAKGAFDALIKDLIADFPQYALQNQGKPTPHLDKPHLRATAGSLGFTAIDDANFKDVIVAVRKHAQAKAGGPLSHGEALPERPKAPPAKRPNNDDALKRAGF